VGPDVRVVPGGDATSAATSGCIGRQPFPIPNAEPLPRVAESVGFVADGVRIAARFVAGQLPPLAMTDSVRIGVSLPAG
jgi:hypothetical protein